MTDEPQKPRPQAPVKMVKNKEGLLVPEDQSNRCLHTSVIKRIKPQIPEYVCKEADDGCGEKLKFITLTWALMTEDEFNTFQAIQAQRMAAAIRQQRTGLVTPGEAKAQESQRSSQQPKMVPPRKGPA
ncbi:hypothetical protein LCGC14_2326670 [marine sediment metagenome]|uniref:Uncharacterized protein n=1 Tax=marine sediment metagenome TaxID=412755 RepID=A0A0F9BTH0_9ZZZZ